MPRLYYCANCNKPFFGLGYLFDHSNTCNQKIISKTITNKTVVKQHENENSQPNN